MSRYEFLEPQESESMHRQDGTPPPLPTRQNPQGALPNKLTPISKKDKESPYGVGKLTYHNHEQYIDRKESTYMSPRVIQESMGYQRLDNSHHQSFVKMQKEKYETKQESLYASHREMQNNDPHKKVCASTSLPLAQGSNYSVSKPTNNNHESEGNFFKFFKQI